MAAYIPPGWPAGVHPPGSEGFEATAVAWLLDVVPPDFRLHGVLRRHPTALATMARHHTQACVEGARAGYRSTRSELGETIPPHAIDAVLAAYRTEGRRLAATARAVTLIERALRGEVFTPRHLCLAPAWETSASSFVCLFRAVKPLAQKTDISMIETWYQARPTGGGQMSAQAQVAEKALYSPSQPMHERTAWYIHGALMLVINVVLAVAAGVLFWQSAVHKGALSAVFAVVGVLLSIAISFGLRGLTVVAPGRAHVVQLFGKYKGTIREPGMQWVNPFTNRIPVSTRIRNLESAQAKVNDADGNPIEIAAVVVWEVQDTAQATFSVDDYVKFVAIQAETAVRHIASSYPYDSRGTDAMSLRENADEITRKLSAELSDRVVAAGVRVIETRLTRLSYAPEIAQAMLRQQAASAVVGARAKIVEGAVGMVKLALERLDEENVVELDEERKAAMVSNLLVVLCSEQATQQVVNTGSLYS